MCDPFATTFSVSQLKSEALILHLTYLLHVERLCNGCQQTNRRQATRCRRLSQQAFGSLEKGKKRRLLLMLQVSVVIGPVFLSLRFYYLFFFFEATLCNLVSNELGLKCLQHHFFLFILIGNTCDLLLTRCLVLYCLNYTGIQYCRDKPELTVLISDFVFIV